MLLRTYRLDRYIGPTNSLSALHLWFPSIEDRYLNNHVDNRGSLVISITTGISILNEIRGDIPYSARNIYLHHSEIDRDI